MDTPATIALIAFALILGCFFAARMIAAVRVNRPKLPPLSVYGDVVELPVAARKRGGGRQIRGDGLAQRTLDRTHVGTGL